MMKASLCFDIHQPYRLRKYRMFDIGKRHDYFLHDIGNEHDHEVRLHEASRSLYRPTAERLYRHLQQQPTFTIVVNISGLALEQLERYDPITLALFRTSARTGRVHIRPATYYNSLAQWYAPKEYERQRNMHRAIVERLLGVTPYAATLHEVPTWVRSDIQRAALQEIYALEDALVRHDDAALLEDWRRLQDADHIRAMDEQHFDDNHTAYVEMHGSPYEAYIAYKNALEDIRWRLGGESDGSQVHTRGIYEPASLLGV